MDERDRPRATFEQPTLLFEEFVEARAAGRDVDPEEFARRAGDREAELRKRISVFQSLEDLAELCGPPPGDEPRAEHDLCELGRYRNLVLIGVGGLSRVFVADDPKLGRRVALKVLNAALIATRDARAWMHNEGRSLAHLEHPHVLRVFEVDEADGQAYIATEYVGGPSLHAVLERMRARARGEPCASDLQALTVDALARNLEPIAARVRLVRTLAEALAHCHARGVIHRDLKPANVILQPGPTPKLIDFGLAHLESEDGSRIHVTQGLMGTPAYLAPEQIDHGRTGASPASDQFSLGIVLYEILTLENPFQRKTRHETIDAISRAAPIAPSRKNRSIPIDLERICLHALERHPSARYPSVDALASDLEAFDDHRSISLLPPTPWKLAALWARRNRRDLLLAAGVVLIAIGCGMGLLVWRASETRAEFRSRLGAAQDRIATLDTSTDFAETYATLRGYEEEARGFDRTWTAFFLGRELLGQVVEAVSGCSHRLWMKFDTLFPEGRGEQGALDQIEAARIFREWRPVFALDALFCPTCPFNEANRARGTLIAPQLGPGERFIVHEFRRPRSRQIAGNQDLVEIPFTSTPVPGTYRFSRHDAAEERISDVDIDVEPHHLRAQVVLPRIDPALKAALRFVPASEFPLYPKKPDERHGVPSFRASGLITWNEIESVFSGEELNRMYTYASRGTTKPEGTAPATLLFSEAQQFASAKGARLPTPLEWYALARFDSDLRSHPDQRITGEYVQGRFDQAKARVIYVVPWVEGVPPQVAEVRTDARVRGTASQVESQGFRLVFSDP